MDIDLQELKRKAEAAADSDWWATGGCLRQTDFDFLKKINPQTVLALIAQIERLNLVQGVLCSEILNGQ